MDPMDPHSAGMTLPGWLTPLAWLFVVLAGVAAVAVAADIYGRGRRQPVRAMEPVWVLSALWLGPLALPLYARIGRPSGTWRQRTAGPAGDLPGAAARGGLPGGAASLVAHVIGVPLVLATGLTIGGLDLYAMILLIAVLATALLFGFEYAVRVHSWLVLPEGASAERPAPLLLWVHGGPLMSWNSWSWRWCPWVMAARGYAVLLPDPALSQGYGQDFVRRGWGAWGEAPYTDLMAAVDAAEQRPEIDGTRTAAMGGSFGGYMANWIATQTDRFRAIVTHASLWDIDSFVGTTDLAYYWEKEWGHPLRQPERYERNSPHRFADAIRTPMLVIHGDRDYRVPIGEALRLWYDLQKRGVPSRFLYFPDENHWVLTPGNAQVWYETVLGFLAEHVLDEEWQRTELL